MGANPGFPDNKDVQILLERLLGRDVRVADADAGDMCEQAVYGLVDDEDVLRYAIGTELGIAHRLGAAIALVPAVRAEEATDPDDELLANYKEVANVLGRLVNEKVIYRVRIDPGMELDASELVGLFANGELRRYAVAVAGYGEGVMGIAAA